MSDVPHSQARYAATPLFLVAAALVCLAPVFWNHVELARIGPAEAESYENSVLYQYVHPAHDYAFGRLRTGDLPLWNPRQLCGTPVFTDPRIGLWQPLHLVFLFLPAPQAMAVHAYLCLSLMGIGFVLFARAIGLGYVPVLLGAIVYAFCGATASAMSRPMLADALAWAPYAFWAVYGYTHTWRLDVAALAGVALGLLMLSGSGALIVATGLVLAAFALAGVLFTQEAYAPGLPRRLAGLGLAGAFALAVSAIQWIPTLLWLFRLEDPMGLVWNLPFAAQAPRSLRNLAMQLFLSRPIALPRIGYIGIIALLLLPAAACYWQRRRASIFFFACTLTLVALFGLFVHRSPLGFPPHAVLFPAVFCVAVLVALGADRLLVIPQGRRAPGVLVPGLLTVAVAVVLFLLSGAQVRGYTLVFLAVLLPLLFLRVGWVLSIGGVLLALVLFVDLVFASANAYPHPLLDADQRLAQRREILSAAREEAVGARAVLSARPLEPGLPGNVGMLYPLDLIGGALLPITHEQAAWWARLGTPRDPLLRASGKGIPPDAPAPQLLNLMAGRVILATPGGPFYDGLLRGEGAPELYLSKTVEDARLYGNRNALPRAYWVPRWRVVEDPRQAIDALVSDDFAPEQECIVDRDPGLGAAPTTASVSRADATCSIETVSPERVIVRVEAPQPGILVLADTFAPGWRLEQGGTRILRANALFRGVAVGAGSTELVFVYRPLSLLFGALVSAAGLIAAGAVVATAAVRAFREEA